MVDIGLFICVCVLLVFWCALSLTMMFCYFKRKEAELKLRLQALMVELQEVKASGEIADKTLSNDKLNVSSPGNILSVENANLSNAQIVKPVLQPAVCKPQSKEKTQRGNNSNCASISLRPPSMKAEFERMPAGEDYTQNAVKTSVCSDESISNGSDLQEFALRAFKCVLMRSYTTSLNENFSPV